MSFKQNLARQLELGPHSASFAHNRGKSRVGGVGVGVGGVASLPVMGSTGSISSGGGTGAGAVAGSSDGSAAVGLQSTAPEQPPVEVPNNNNNNINNNRIDSTAGTATGNNIVWSPQPCPLVIPRNSNVLREEDLAITLARSSHSKNLPGDVLSSTRTTGTCLFKWKMGIYTNH